MGNFVRSIDVKYSITNQAVGNHNYVYFGLDFHKGCLAQADVTQDIDPIQWEYLTNGAVDGPVGISDNVVYSGSEDGKVRSCLEDKTPSWPLLPDSAFDTQSQILSGIAVDSRSCYCATTSGTFFCRGQSQRPAEMAVFRGRRAGYSARRSPIARFINTFRAWG